MNEDLISYYNERAGEYDKVYLNPAEQDDLQAAATVFQSLFSGKTVLEIACGTGYWTERIAQTAASIHATDVNESMIGIARGRQQGGNVTFSIADLYHLQAGEKYGGVFGGFIWSHIPLRDLDGLLERLAGFLEEGGPLVFIDSNFVENTPHDSRKIARTDAYGNTFQSRVLENGTTHLVLKNFPTPDFLTEKLSRIGVDVQVVNLKYYWIASCRAGKAGLKPAI